MLTILDANKLTQLVMLDNVKFSTIHFRGQSSWAIPTPSFPFVCMPSSWSVLESGQPVPRWLQGLTMATPLGMEVHENLREIPSQKSEYRTALLQWPRFVWCSNAPGFSMQWHGTSRIKTFQLFQLQVDQLLSFLTHPRSPNHTKMPSSLPLVHPTSWDTSLHEWLGCLLV